MSEPISSDLHAVPSEVAQSAANVCDADDVIIGLVEADELRIVAQFGSLPRRPASVIPFGGGGAITQAVQESRSVHIPDHWTSTEYRELRELAQQQGFRAALNVPLIKDGTAFGVITGRRADPRPFTHREISMLETYARLAATAIERARLAEALDQRNAELQGALDRQTATSEVLQIISRSPTEVEPVFQAIADAAWCVLRVTNVRVWRRAGEHLELAAAVGHIETIGRRVNIADQRAPVCVAIAERRTVYLPDVEAPPIRPREPLDAPHCLWCATPHDGFIEPA